MKTKGGFLREEKIAQFVDQILDFASRAGLPMFT
jgi:hypothetical protein